jgi:hypothetical protein
LSDPYDPSVAATLDVAESWPAATPRSLLRPEDAGSRRWSAEEGCCAAAAYDAVLRLEEPPPLGRGKGPPLRGMMPARRWFLSAALVAGVVLMTGGGCEDPGGAYPLRGLLVPREMVLLLLLLRVERDESPWLEVYRVGSGLRRWWCRVRERM